MKCNPLRWLWGLIPLVLLWWIGILGMQQQIEVDLAQRSKEQLERNGLSWANVVFKGRDGMIVGRAEEESDQRRPGHELAKLWGVRGLEDRIEVLQLVKDYKWQAATRDNTLGLTGHVPNEAARKAILASARSAFPKHTVDDKMELARGAPEQTTWLGGTAFALRQLAALKSGGKAGLDAAGLVVEGEADSSKSYETVRGALTRSLPQGINLKTERVIPPVVKPYTWAAALRGRQVELTGHAPSLAARDQLKAAAEKAVPGATVVDRMTLASGAPTDWQKVASAALTQFGQLKQGNAEMVDGQVSVTGLTETEATADSVRKALRSQVAAPFRLNDQIRQDPAVVAAEEARRAADEAARRAAAEAEKRRAEDEARRQAEAEVRRNQTEAERNEAAKRAAEAKAKADEDARRAAEARAKSDADRRSTDEAAKRAADEAAKKLAATRLAADEAAKRAAAEAEAQRMRVSEAQRCQQSLASAAEAGTIRFQRASAELDRRSHETLDALAKIVKGCPGFAVEVGGHTDNEGEPGRNQRLSERRAQSVLDYLVKAGVPAASLNAAGYGEVQPKVPNTSPENMARNRRIEFSVKAK